MYKVPALKTLASGGHYIGFECTSCHADYAFMEDQSKGKATLDNIHGDGVIFCICPHCGNPGYFQHGQVKQFTAA